MEPQKHHYLPECYLKVFANRQKQLFRRHKDINKASICTPAQVGYEIGINKIRTEETLLLNQLTDPNYIEKETFKRQENNYGKTLSRVIRFSESPIVIDKTKYRLFLETLITIKRRNPQTRKDIIKAFENGYNSQDTVPSFIEHLFEEAKKDNIELEIGIEERVKEYLEKRVTNPEWLHDMYLTGYLNSTDYDVIDKITKRLYDLKQFILHAPINSQFVTSDNPGFTKIGDTILKTGGFGSSFEFYFPLSPYTCLFLNSETKENDKYIEKCVYSNFVSASRVKEINMFTKFVSTNKLFGNNKMILELI